MINADSGTINILRNVPADEFVICFDPGLEPYESEAVLPLGIMAHSALERTLVDDDYSESGVAVLAVKASLFGSSSNVQDYNILSFLEKRQSALQRVVEGGQVNRLGRRAARRFLKDWRSQLA